MGGPRHTAANMADNPSSELSTTEAQLTRAVEAPTVTFESLTFSDGSVVTLDESDIVVFVGPNNAGKSAALRELEQCIGPPTSGVVIRAATLRRNGTGKQLLDYLELQNKKRGDEKNPDYFGYRFTLRAQDVEGLFTSRLDVLRPFFCLRMATETKITDSNTAGAIPILDELPSNPIHLLFADERIEQRISGYFHTAFNQDLIVFRAGGSQWLLLVGSRPELKPGEQLFGIEYNKRLRSSSIPLQSQGDGIRSFASVILHLLTPNTPSVLLLDEPEAFLHPPQARLLGEFIVKEKPKRAQLFIATHSADVLQGLLNVASDKLRVLRIHREGLINRVKELDKTSHSCHRGGPADEVYKCAFGNFLSTRHYCRGRCRLPFL